MTTTSVVDAIRFIDPLVGFAFQLEADQPRLPIATGSPVSTRSTTTRGTRRTSITREASAPLWTTQDGGAHWHASGLRGVVAFALGGHAAYVLTGRCDRHSCDDLALHRFGASTRHWTTLPLPFTSAAPTVSMTARGATVWIAAQPRSIVRGGARLWASSDRGAHFAARTAPCPASSAVVSAASSTSLWAVCDAKTTTVRRSTDGGTVWKPVAVTAALSATATIAPTGDAAAVLSTGTGRALLRTTNGGKTFQNVTPKAAHGRWVFLQFALSRDGGALLFTPTKPATSTRPGVQLWRSTDAGVAWSGPERFRS